MKIGFMIWEMFNGYFVHSKAKKKVLQKRKRKGTRLTRLSGIK